MNPYVALVWQLAANGCEGTREGGAILREASTQSVLANPRRNA